MKRFIVFSVIALLLLSFTMTSEAVIGIPDHMGASTLIVPMFEVGINSTTHPHDTLLVVTNKQMATITVHYEVWSVYGGTTANVYGNFTLNPADSQSFSMRSLISTYASNADKSMLTDPIEPSFYRGFVTFDVVTSSTSATPLSVSYPFSSANYLIGFIYYTRLTQGSSNGLSMLPLESVPTSTASTYMWSFYQCTDDREQIDADARWIAQMLTEGGTVTTNPNNAINRIYSRVFTEAAYNGSTRIVIFTFPHCTDNACLGNTGGCGPGGPLTTRWYDETGAIILDTTITLTRVVTILYPSGGANGYLSIWNLPEYWHTYAFSINAGSPGFDPSLTWDAIHESFILP